MQTFWLVTHVHLLIIFYALVFFSLFFVFVFSEAGDLLFMNLCNEGKQPVLEAITHRPKVGLIYIVYIANLISHFVLSLVCKSSWEYMVMMHKFTLSAPTRNIYSIYFYVSCLDCRDSSPLNKKKNTYILYIFFHLCVVSIIHLDV